MALFLMIIHALACVLLVTIILMQSGRGGGLTESFASAESMFGAKTNEFLIKGTTTLAVIFLVTNLALALLNSKEGKSLMSDKAAQEVAGQTATIPSPAAANNNAAAVEQKAKEVVPQAAAVEQKAVEAAPVVEQKAKEALPAPAK